ncbi:NEDD8-activating enzyme E1 regulatory subunit [Nymphon striatum]|nr:NEDD8-activating enzyme E1 regulatory subunit [Nymphon striatum]
MTSLPVLSKSPDHEKHKKYDRQLRLWGDHGQSNLESANICLLNASVTGTEILKSIVLPGIGGFTIVDGQLVTKNDIGTNFFLTAEDIGKSRAKSAMNLLLELNSDVHGDFVDESPEHVFENNPTFFDKFSVVIATNLNESTLLKLSDLLWRQNIPLLICKTYGMIGYMRIQVREHTVIESHPDNTHEDLRLDRPFSKLLNYVNSINLESMDKTTHKHTPYLVIILKNLLVWQSKNNGKLPKTYKEKEMFRKMIKEGNIVHENGVMEEEENFEEAIKAVNTALIPSKIPSNVEEIFNDSCCQNISHESSNFWILAKALKDFVDNEGHGLLPLRGSLPDMFSDSKRYINLQNLYHEEAALHIELVTKHVDDILSDIGRSQGSIPDSDIKLFCNNLENPDSEISYYVLLRAVDRFYVNYNRYPGTSNDEKDIVNLKGVANKLLQEWNCGPLIQDDCIHEMCKFGACEVPSIAAFIGGCAAQEVIKLVTHQYVPFNNTFIYNGINVSCSVINL